MKQYSLLGVRDDVLKALKGTDRNNTRGRKWVVKKTGYRDRLIREAMEYGGDIGNLGNGLFIMRTKEDFIDYEGKLKRRAVSINKHSRRVHNKMLDISCGFKRQTPEY